MSRSTVARAALLVLFLLLTACGGATAATCRRWIVAGSEPDAGQPVFLQQQQWI